MKKQLILATILLIISTFSCVEKDNKSNKPYVILISFDGFRHDYVEKYNTPNFKALIKEGVAADAMLPSYPSKTFPNHYTIVTGMYPDNHGLVDNNFYDAELDLQYSISNRDVVENPAFYGGLPLWQLVQQNDMKSASYFWVGSETSIAGSYPNYYHIYDGSVPNDERVNAVIEWLKLPENERPNFISLYFSLVDSAGHGFGPNGEKTKEAVLEADRLLGLLMTLVNQIDLPINIVVTSDHGMHEITPQEDSYITVPDLLGGLDRDKFRFVSNGAHGHFYGADTAYLAEIANILKTRKESSNYQVFFKAEMPEYWHYGTNNRVGDLFVKMNPGHYLTSPQRKSQAIRLQAFRGEHGFDPGETEDMGAIFYAKGPNFKSGMKIGKFRNIHVYPLIASVLGITSLPEIDGNLEVLKPILK
ncbi:alkaline phosphatase family protein [Roseivirga misakiensis]|uniref:Phosphodiesterase n=1 Tax=Roseivirga misakiensis TaxID=1563681 RepID=A0A1E5T2N7_9BACT|nr:ectonucleotide pyrophosphatase/phosphodiesterase [Roseivirga misakiensis]OEK05653.1 hypothetical protein BFP71_17945 [Roseivirga misakiensis]